MELGTLQVVTQPVEHLGLVKFNLQAQEMIPH